MQDIVARVPTLAFIDMARRAGLRASRTIECGRRIRHVSLPHASAERARLLLLARSMYARADTALRMVRHQVARRHARHARDQVHAVVHAAAVLRSVARSLAEGTVLSRRGSVDREARHGCARALSRRPGPRRHPADRARRWDPFRELPWPQVLRSRWRTWCTRISKTKPSPETYDFLREDFAALDVAPRRRGRHQLPDVPVLPAALHRAPGGAAAVPGRRQGRPGRAVARRRNSPSGTRRTICTCVNS